MSRRKPKMDPERVMAFVEQFSDLLRADGWSVDVVKAKNVTNPEDIILVTIRLGSKP